MYLVRVHVPGTYVQAGLHCTSTQDSGIRPIRYTAVHLEWCTITAKIVVQVIGEGQRRGPENWSCKILG